MVDAEGNIFYFGRSRSKFERTDLLMIELCCEYLSVGAFNCMFLSCHVRVSG